MKCLETFGFKFLTEKERSELKQRMVAAKELRESEDPPKTMSVKVRLRPFKVRNDHRVVGIQQYQHREIIVDASDLAHMLRELDYIVHDKTEQLR